MSEHIHDNRMKPYCECLFCEREKERRFDVLFRRTIWGLIVGGFALAAVAYVATFNVY